jgi:hypothetical protein
MELQRSHSLLVCKLLECLCFIVSDLSAPDPLYDGQSLTTSVLRRVLTLVAHKEIKARALYLDPTVIDPCTQIQWMDYVPPLRASASSQIGNNSRVQGLQSLNHSLTIPTTSVSSFTTPPELSNLKQVHFLCSPCAFLSPQMFSTLVPVLTQCTLCTYSTCSLLSLQSFQ